MAPMGVPPLQRSRLGRIVMLRAVFLKATALTRSAAFLVMGVLCQAAMAEEPLGLDAPWHEGSRECTKSPGPALEVHRYDARTLILREGLCSSTEAPFLYLLLGEHKALLIDTGDVSDPKQVNLASAIQLLLPETNGKRLPLLVVHTHRHRDHRSGDAQLRKLPGVEVVGYDLASVKRFFDLPQWPQGTAQIDLGERAVDVLPAPGHEGTELVFYDRGTALVFSGDFLLPGRILVDDTEAYRESVLRVSHWLEGRPVTAFLGGHIEMDTQGELYPAGSSYHPHERPLPMDLAELKTLSEGLAQFNGFYTRSGDLVLQNSLRILALIAFTGGLLLAALTWGLLRLRRRARRLQRSPAPMAGS